MRYAMLIDLKRCTGCQACTMACKVHNGTPPNVFFSRVRNWEEGVYPNVHLHFLPVLCNHCKEAPCVAACPTGATQKLENGIVTVDQEKCIGCQTCMVACPYGVRTFFSDNPESYYPEVGASEYEKVKYANFIKGTVKGCDFCMDRVADGKKPACVASCISEARFFGDLDDPNDYVAGMVARGLAKPLHPEFGTEPSVFYVQE